MIVSQYAQKTGDFAQLSKTDIKLIALSYMLEKELCGTKNLRDITAVRTLDENTILQLFYNHMSFPFIVYYSAR